MAIKNITYNGDALTLSYEIINPTSSRTILFLHGWGANKELMKRAFGGYFKDFCLIFVDFPGFGGSNIKTALNSFDVKAIIELFLASIQKDPNIIVGHSFGGKIALLLNPKTLVLLSSAGIVLPKRLWVRVKIRLFKIARFFGLSRFYAFFASKDVKGMPPVMYETFKKVVNEDMSEYFKSYEGRAIVFWGESDKTTPLACCEKIIALVKNSRELIFKGDHFFFLDEGERIEEEVLKKGICIG